MNGYSVKRTHILQQLQFLHIKLFSFKYTEILLTGSKVLVIKFGEITIKDSINFIPMASTKIRKTFDLKELKKGYFPHLFNTPENQDYVGNVPNKKFYNHEFMSVKERPKFLEWYDQQTTETFNLQKELHDYCKSDVNILAKACLSFRLLFMSITRTYEQDIGVDPFAQCITLPSACHYVYRRNFMKPKSIVLIPSYGYHYEQTSYKAIKWLKYIMGTHKIYIQHAKNGT